MVRNNRRGNTGASRFKASKSSSNPDVHVYNEKVVCVTNRRGFATPENRSAAEIVVDANEGFVPLWDRNVILRWQFDDVSMEYFDDPNAAIAGIRELMGEAILAWGDASPVKFKESDGIWDFRVEMRDADRCNDRGCVLASAFFPDTGHNRLVLYPELFEQSHKEQVETMIHEIGHIFGLRHFFANISETWRASEIFGTHSEFSIMNYGHKSVLTETDKSDLKKLYQLAWSGQLTDINGTPIRLVRPLSSVQNQLVVDVSGRDGAFAPVPHAAMMSVRHSLGASLNLSEELIPIGKKNRPGTQIDVDFITIHNTDNATAGADAKAHSNFVRNTGYYMWNGSKRWVSWHYTVDDKEVIKHLPIDEKAIHAGSGNERSIAIETCMHSGIDQDAANDRLSRLVAVLLYDLNLDTSKVVPHKHWTNKNCPRLLLPIWDDFIEQIEQYLHQLRSAGSFESPVFSRLNAELEHEAIASMVNGAMKQGCC